MANNNWQQLWPLIDLTCLNAEDTPETITHLCQHAVIPSGHVAAVCVYPQFVKQACLLLTDTPVQVATVVNFPDGTDSLDVVSLDIQQAILAGATEIDMVFPTAHYLQGNHDASYEFVRRCKVACGSQVLLKVILETGILLDPALIAEVSYHVCYAGADFLKTSTGKKASGATLEAVRVMLEVIKKIPRSIGVKVSGGVHTVEQATQYVDLAQKMMGNTWVTPQHFRLGTSRCI